MIKIAYVNEDSKIVILPYDLPSEFLAEKVKDGLNELLPFKHYLIEQQFSVTTS